MKIKPVTYLIFIFSFYGCGFEKLGEWKISTLYAQKIEGTSKILYKYDAWEDEIQTPMASLF